LDRLGGRADWAVSCVGQNSGSLRTVWAVGDFRRARSDGVFLGRVNGRSGVWSLARDWCRFGGCDWARSGVGIDGSSLRANRAVGNRSRAGGDGVLHGLVDCGCCIWGLSRDWG